MKRSGRAILMFIVCCATANAQYSSRTQDLAGLSSSDWHVREQAAETLGSSGDADREVVSALTAALGDSDSRVRKAAADALGHLGPKASYH